MTKDTIKLNMEAYGLPQKPGRPSKITVEQMDKIAKLYALAEKLHVKIGGDDNDNQRPRKLLPDKP